MINTSSFACKDFDTQRSPDRELSTTLEVPLPVAYWSELVYSSYIQTPVLFKIFLLRMLVVYSWLFVLLQKYECAGETDTD